MNIYIYTYTLLFTIYNHFQGSQKPEFLNPESLNPTASTLSLNHFAKKLERDAGKGVSQLFQRIFEPPVRCLDIHHTAKMVGSFFGGAHMKLSTQFLGTFKGSPYFSEYLGKGT